MAKLPHPIQVAGELLAKRARGLDQEMYLVDPVYYQIQPVLMYEMFQKHLAIRPDAKGDLVCLYGQVTKDLSGEGEVNVLSVSGLKIPFLKLAVIFKLDLEWGDVIYLITSHMAPEKSQKITMTAQNRIRKSRKWTTRQPLSLHFLTGKMKAGSGSAGVEAGFTTNDKIPVMGIDFVASVSYTFKLSKYTLKKSDIAWFKAIDEKLENRFNNLLGLKKDGDLVLKTFFDKVSFTLKIVIPQMDAFNIVNKNAKETVNKIATKIKDAQNGKFYRSGKLLSEKEKKDPKTLLKWIDNLKQETLDSFNNFIKDLEGTGAGKEPGKEVLFFKGHQSGIIQLIDSFYFQYQEAVSTNPATVEKGQTDTCYLEVKRYDHEVKPGLVYSIALANPSESGVTFEGTNSLLMEASITKSVYQTYVNQNRGKTKRKLILTQSNRVNYKKIEFQGTVEGIVKIEGVEAGAMKSGSKPILNIMDYYSVSIYWAPMPSKKGPYQITPLPGSGISFGTSAMLVDLENAAKELESGKFSPYYEKKVKGYARSLRLKENEVHQFLEKFGEEMKKEVSNRFRAYQMVLLESTYRLAEKGVNIQVTDYKTNKLEELRDIAVIKSALTTKNNYQPKMDKAGLKLESILVRVRIADSSSSELPIFRLGYYADGSGGSVMFTGKKEAGNQGIINFSPFFFKDMLGKSLSEKEKIDRAVPPVFLVPHTL